mgnify:CR=1 FL=1
MKRPGQQQIQSNTNVEILTSPYGKRWCNMYSSSRQIEAIWHNNKPASMTTNEWRSLDEITRSTIRIHMAKNVYFSMVLKETITFSLWEKLQAISEKKPSSSKLILIRELFNMKMRETDPVTSHINTFSRVLSELFSQGINFKEKVNALALLLSLSASWEVFCMIFVNNFLKLNLDETIGQILTADFDKNRWDSWSMNWQMPTTR